MSEIAAAIRKARSRGMPALIPYLTAGYPTKEDFLSQLMALSSVGDVIEIGVPFSDPMADGTTIQRSSRVALAQGVSLRWILEQLTAAPARPKAPVILMSYLNPLLAFGIHRLPEAAARAGVSGFIVPDLPYEECADLRAALQKEGLALVQLVTPVTPDARLKMLCDASEGFVYAVTMTGITGGNAAMPQKTLDYFERVRSVSKVPVCAGFGIRSREQIERLSPYVDGVVVASALVEAVERGEKPVDWLKQLTQASAME